MKKIKLGFLRAADQVKMKDLFRLSTHLFHDEEGHFSRFTILNWENIFFFYLLSWKKCTLKAKPPHKLLHQSMALIRKSPRPTQCCNLCSWGPWLKIYLYLGFFCGFNKKVLQVGCSLQIIKIWSSPWSHQPAHNINENVRSFPFVSFNVKVDKTPDMLFCSQFPLSWSFPFAKACLTFFHSRFREKIIN